MHFGIFQFATDFSMPIDALARAVEERGFDSLWVPEHTHIPASRKTPYPGGGELPKEYYHSLDPFVALTAAAAATRTLKLGTGICLLMERDTITTAKAAATLDMISNGRLLFGLGGGWNREEMENHGTDFDTRFKKLEEQVRAMRIIWTEEEAEFHGKYVDFDPIWSWPKPVQKPHPPIILGGETIHTLRRVVRHAEGWLPRARNPELVLKALANLRQLAGDAGRDMSTISISIFGVPPRDELIARFGDTEAERIILGLPSADDSDAILKRLDDYTAYLT
jgi:probable F420-dependent oxidoreductase